jgi:hypothetical protein
MNKAVISIHVRFFYGYKFLSNLGKCQEIWLLDDFIRFFKFYFFSTERASVCWGPIKSLKFQWIMSSHPHGHLPFIHEETVAYKIWAICWKIEDLNTETSSPRILLFSPKYIWAGRNLLFLFSTVVYCRIKFYK